MERGKKRNGKRKAEKEEKEKARVRRVSSGPGDCVEEQPILRIGQLVFVFLPLLGQLGVEAIPAAESPCREDGLDREIQPFSFFQALFNFSFINTEIY